ncbi:ATP-dependent protease La domain-domain-containing protein [Protomyces lactucae-debilis]|uniref:ATP-dependent protease La domain-domain-containing protein n=1 Tax=Protomyces lactucae-debilis TaxID=2754530 RepID=A0A1Y2FK91_PROLT|nr:ATP-dependent protease La domain-containing protein [Protomyces lactucae-debilis]ORY84349.1 ATP-dependent protease La domain-domain-containing protein [Protomyces lactucae-debilis]
MAAATPAILPVIPLLKESILFPSLVLRLVVDRKDTAAHLSSLVYATDPSPLIACIPQRLDSTRTADPITASISEIKANLATYGCLGRLIRMERTNGTVIAVIEGRSRIRMDACHVAKDGSGMLEAQVTYFKDGPLATTDMDAQTRLASLKGASTELITTLKGLKLPAVLLRRLENFIGKANGDNAGQLCDLMSSVVEGSYEEKIAILQATDVSERVGKVHELVSRQLNTIKVTRKISSTVDQTLNKQQKEYILRQKLSAIKKELSQATGDDGGEEEDDASELQKRIDAAELSTEARTVATKELKRLKRMQPQQAEYQVIRTYLDHILEVPWLKQSQSQALERTSIEAARRQLDDDHFGLEKVKKRLIEYLAILRLRQMLEAEKTPEFKL